YVMIPRMVPGTGPAYLGVAHKPFETQADPAQTGPFKVPNFNLPSGITLERVGDRKGLIRSFDAVREKYGFLPAFDPKASNRCGCPAWSQRILLARRLVEAGVRLVTVDLRWWDTHVKGFESLKLGFLPRFDLAYSALIEDLHARGLMEKTLVVAWGEFGRTPRVNNDAGRDHYPNVFSAAIAGGKVKGGRVVGASDSH